MDDAESGAEVVSGPRFVAVPAAALLTELRDIASKVRLRGGIAVETAQGREVVFDLSPFPHSARPRVRIYTSLATGASEIRSCGEDAVRVVVLAPDASGRDRSVVDPVKVLRTAPTKLSEEERVGVFLERLRDVVREAYRAAGSAPICRCGLAMARRESAHGFFFGCIGYPSCRETRNAT